MLIRSFVGLALALLGTPAAWFRGGRGRRRRRFGHGKELAAYRNELFERTQRIDLVVGGLAESVDALRRRELEVDDALAQLSTAEDELDTAADQLRAMLAPEELHALHVEYEANLERALRGIVTAERGCGITRLPPAARRRGAVHLLQTRLPQPDPCAASHAGARGDPPRVGTGQAR